MNLRAVQEIREAEPHQRMEKLIDDVCGRGASQRRGIHDEFLKALDGLKEFRFSVSQGYHMTVVPPDNNRKPMRKVVITENEFNQVVRKEYESDTNAYEFLCDYLGLSAEKPFSPAKMVEKYPLTTKVGGEGDEDWYDEIARVLLKGVKRKVFGPGKKEF